VWPITSVEQLKAIHYISTKFARANPFSHHYGTRISSNIWCGSPFIIAIQDVLFKDQDGVGMHEII